MNEANLQWQSNRVPAPGRYVVLLKVQYGLVVGQATYQDHRWYAKRDNAEVIAFAPLPEAEQALKY
jgi:hypothetical protein